VVTTSKEIRAARTDEERAKKVTITQGQLDDVLDRLDTLEANMKVAKSALPSYTFPA
jgi:hypothetical protein